MFTNSLHLNSLIWQRLKQLLDQKGKMELT